MKKYNQQPDQLRLFAEEGEHYTTMGNLEKNIKVYTKDALIDELRKIRKLGWILNARRGNVGGVGNTLEDLLGIEENNLPLPNAAEWELKCQRADTTSLITLCHSEPSPRALRFVPQILLPYYGWQHKEAGKNYEINEMSFRQTISGAGRSDRGFMVMVDRGTQKLLISFDAKEVDRRHIEWLNSVERRIGLSELEPQPYWGFVDLEHKIGTKLLNSFYIQAKVKKEKKQEFYWYSDIMMLQGFNLEKLLTGIEQGFVYIDFDARTGHNHGTKFRLRQNMLPQLYEHVTIIE